MDFRDPRFAFVRRVLRRGRVRESLELSTVTVGPQMIVGYKQAFWSTGNGLRLGTNEGSGRHRFLICQPEETVGFGRDQDGVDHAAAFCHAGISLQTLEWSRLRMESQGVECERRGSYP